MHNHTAQNEQAVTLVLPVSHVNMVLRALAELPLKESQAAFNNVQTQAEADIQRQREFMRMQQESANQNTNAQPSSQES